MEYLYNDGTLFYFIDQDTYEQISLADQSGDALKFLQGERKGQNSLPRQCGVWS